MDLPLILRRRSNYKQHFIKDEVQENNTRTPVTNTDNIIKNLKDSGLSVFAENSMYDKYHENNLISAKIEEQNVINDTEAEDYQYVALPYDISSNGEDDIELNFELETLNSSSGNDFIKYEDIEILDDENTCDYYIKASDLVDGIMLYNRTDLSCSICKKQCNNRADLKEHESLHLNFQCKSCDKAFYREAYLKKHLKSAHKPADTPRIPCNICSKTFKSKYNMQQHMLIHSGERRYKCTLCDKAFTQTSSLGTHMRCHVGVRQICPICELPMSKIKEHMRTHTGEKPYACETCGRCFATTSQRKAHFITHTKVKNYKCELCNVLFTQLSSLYKHNKSLHGEVTKFPCPHCIKVFNRKDNLKTHIQCVHEKTVEKKSKYSQYFDCDDPDLVETIIYEESDK